jgi:hypothetical protein
MKPKKIKLLQDYKNQFSLPESGNKPDPKTALETALDIRKFEIDLYWKRATYSWAFIAASFTGYIAVTTQKTPNLLLESLFACLGLIFSLSWFLVNKGSKYWQENWEMHVDLLEDISMGPLYKTTCHNPYQTEKATFLNNLFGPRRYSVTRINIAISFFVALVWAGFFIGPILKVISILYSYGVANILHIPSSQRPVLEVTAFVLLNVITILFCLYLWFKGLSYEPEEGPGVYSRKITILTDTETE